MEIPESARGSNIVHTPLPFLFGMKAEKRKPAINSPCQRTDESATIVAAADGKGSQNYRKADHSDKKHISNEGRMLSEEEWISYVFKNVKPNDRKFLPEISGKILIIQISRTIRLSSHRTIRRTAFSGERQRPRKGFEKTAPESAPSNAQKRTATCVERGKVGTMKK